MLLLGTRGVTTTTDRGRFHCPACNHQEYARKRVRRFLTLYFLPLIPLGRLGEYVECLGCENTYRVEVLDFEPQREAETFEAEFHRAIKRVMVLMVLADDRVHADELQVVQQVYERLTRVALSKGDLNREMDRARSEGLDVVHALSRFAGRLNDGGREKVVRAACFVAAADGHVAEQERQLLADIAVAVAMKPAKARALLRELSA